MAGAFVFIILSIPIYGLLIWTYVEPEESFLFGRRWMYDEEPELSEGMIRYTKIGALVSLVLLTISFLAIIISLF